MVFQIWRVNQSNNQFPVFSGTECRVKQVRQCCESIATSFSLLDEETAAAVVCKGWPSFHLNIAFFKEQQCFGFGV